MPVRKVNGGYRWGQSGKVYPTKAQAQRQGRAIYASGYQEGGVTEARARNLLDNIDGRSTDEGAEQTDGRSFLDVLRQAAQLRGEAEMVRQQGLKEIREKLTPTPAQSAWIGAQLDPTVVTGAIDIAGQYPGWPAADVPLEEAFSGEPGASLAENLRTGHPFVAGLQTLGVIPGIGAITRGTRAAAKLVKQAKIAAAGKRSPDAEIGEGIAGVAAKAEEGKATRAAKIAALRAEANAQRFGDEAAQGIRSIDVDTSYRISHQPMPRDPEAIQLDNLSKDISGNQSGYPDDFYSSEGQGLYAQGPRFAGDEYGIANEQSYKAIIEAKGNPEAEVTIYRAVPEGIDTINQGDFVTLSPKYAELHASSGYGRGGDEAGKVISQKVKVKDVLWAGDDVNEFGYAPSSADKISEGIAGVAAKAEEMKKFIGDVPNRLDIKPDTKLSGDMADIQRRFAEQLNSDVGRALDDYVDLPGSDGGRILNTDLARELSPDYRADRSLSAAVHEPASAFVKKRYVRLLKEQAPFGKDNTVLFTGGGTGAGKSTALDDALLDQTVSSQIIYDTNMASFDGSVEKIEQALDADKKVVIAYVYRDAMEALTGASGSAVTRAKRMGRTVPLDAHVNTHTRSAETIRELSKRYKDNPNVAIEIIDNSRGAGNAVNLGEDLSIIPEMNYDELWKEARYEINKGFQEGWIPEKIYRGFIGHQTGGRSPP